MRRRSNSHSPISLFTFLDTLVCTMGSLILMLLAMTPKIRERAEARELARLAAQVQVVPEEAATEPLPLVAETPPKVAATAPEPDDSEKERAFEKQKRRDVWQQSVEDARKELAEKQAAYRRQRELLKDAHSQVKDTEEQILKARLKEESLADADQALTEQETKLEALHAKIAQKIAMTRKNIELLNRKQAAAPNEFALIPYDGNSGTARRPIYIECSKKGFRFLPEGETVSPLDLKNFNEGFNPLLTGTQSLLRYWSRKRRESGGTEPEPYVLLLVRPSGCINYYLARGLLASVGANFGYELIEEDWKLSIPPADPVAKSILKQTLDMTVQTYGGGNDALAEAGQRGGFGSGGRNSGGSRWSNGFPSGEGDDAGRSLDDATPRAGRKPSIKLGTPTRQGRLPVGSDPNGSAAHDLGGATGSGSGSGNGAGTGSEIAAIPGAIPGDRRGGKTGDPRALGSAVGAKAGSGSRGNGTGGVGDDGQSSPGDGTGDGSGTQFGSRRSSGGKSGGAGAAGIGSGTGGKSGSGAADGTEGTGDDPKGTGTARGNGTRGGRGGGSGARPATIGGAPADSGSGRGSGGGSGDADESLELPPDYVPGRFPDDDGGEGSGGSADGVYAPRGAPRTASGKQGAGGIGVDGGSSLAGSSPFGSSKSGTGSAGSASSSADVSGGSGPSSDSGSPGGSGGGAPGPMGGPGATFSLGGKGQRRSSSKDGDPDGPRIAESDANANGPRGRSRGPRKWGKSPSQATIGLERKIEIRLLADRILVGSKDVSIPVGNGETVEEMINQVVMGIDHTAEKWGEPPASFYWLPAVKFVVYPGGNQYYERLHGPLETKWGVNSTVDYAPDQKPAKAAGARP